MSTTKKQKSRSGINGILFLLQSDYPTDTRLAMEACSLISAGYSVHLLCNNKSGRLERERVEGLEVFRLPRYLRLPRKIGILIRMPLFFNPIWIWKGIKILRSNNMDVLHVCDLPMMPLGLILGELFRLPVIYDMRENYPAAMLEWKERSLFARLFKNPYLALLLDRYCTRKASRIIVVVEEQKANLIGQGIQPEKVEVISNTVDLDYFCNMPLDRSIMNRYHSRPLITYIGIFSIERGLQIALRGMRLLKEEIPELRLLLAGDGKYKEALVGMVKEWELDEHVEFTGWIDFKTYPSYIASSRICIIPQPSNRSNDFTIPLKLFQFMAMGKPVVAADAKPMKRILAECQAGELFQSNSPEDFARAVLKVYHSRFPYGLNGRQAVQRKYNWTVDSRVLLDLYKTLSS